MTAEWNGQGKPPADTVCDFRRRAGDDWRAVEVKYMSATTCVLRPLIKEGSLDELVLHPNAGDFRVHLTAEQLAAEERLTAINLMEMDAGMVSTAFDGDPEARVWIENLVDRGWRKAVTP